MTYIDEIADAIAYEVDGKPLSDEWRPLYRIYAVLCLAKGDETSKADVHDAWSAYMAGVNPTHHSLVPFDKLPRHIQALDGPYQDAIQIVAEIRKGTEGEIPDRRKPYREPVGY